MDRLNEILRQYLRRNGITTSFFAKYIGCDRTRCTKWLSGERKLSPEQLTKAMEFLTGVWITPLDQIVSIKDTTMGN